MWKPRTITVVSVVAVFGFIGLITPNSETSTPNFSPTASSTQTSTPSSEPSPGASSIENANEGSGEVSGVGDQTPSTAPNDTNSDPSSELTPEATRTPQQQESESELVTERESDQTETNIYSALLAGLNIEPEVISGYDRDLFKHWIDADRDGCNARSEVLLIESLTAVTLGDRCKVESGSWLSRYDGATITDSSKLDIDHMIPLKEAWDSGANAWSADRRQAFANDLDLPEALIAVSAGSNRSKSAKDPAEWIPTAGSYVCQYVKDWMSVKTKWQLSVDQREFEALRSMSLGCVND